MRCKLLLIALAVVTMSSTIHADFGNLKELEDPSEENYIATETITQCTPTNAIDVWTFSGPTAVFTLTNSFDHPFTLPNGTFLEADPAKDFTTFISGSSQFFANGGFSLALADLTGLDNSVQACPTSSCVTGVVNVRSVELFTPFS